MAKVNAVGTRLLDPDDPFDGLTSKQQLFVSLSFSGLSDVEAYRKSYDCTGMTTASIANKAHETAYHPLVKAKLRKLVDSRDDQSTLASFLTREWILNGIAGIAQAADKDSTRLNAYVALGKTAGIDLFRETVRHENVTRTEEDVTNELKAKLEQLRNTLTIEGKANDAPRSDRRRKPKTT